MPGEPEMTPQQWIEILESGTCPQRQDWNSRAIDPIHEWMKEHGYEQTESKSDGQSISGSYRQHGSRGGGVTRTYKSSLRKEIIKFRLYSTRWTNMVGVWCEMNER